MADNLNAAQLQAIEQKARAALSDAIQQMQLRKWAMEQAVAIFSSCKLPADLGLKEYAAEIYAFVAKPAIEFKVEP